MKKLLTLLATVARAVHAAHTTGIVHRDLKPSNILLDDQGKPFVSDFGVAALLAGESVTISSDDTPDDRQHVQTRLTRTGGGVGTPAYSAPDRVHGLRIMVLGIASLLLWIAVRVWLLHSSRATFAAIGAAFA